MNTRRGLIKINWERRILIPVTLLIGVVDNSDGVNISIISLNITVSIGHDFDLIFPVRPSLEERTSLHVLADTRSISVCPFSYR